jgi:hypothetical protein
MIRLLALGLLLATGCGATCTTADLDARYAVQLALTCDDVNQPLEECEAHAKLAAEYERLVVERLEADPCPVLK